MYTVVMFKTLLLKTKKNWHSEECQFP